MAQDSRKQPRETKRNREGDVLGDYSFDEPLRPGSSIVFEDMIHYIMVKTTFFNGVRHPSIGIWKNGRFELVRGFTYEQFKAKL